MYSFRAVIVKWLCLRCKIWNLHITYIVGCVLYLNQGIISLKRANAWNANMLCSTRNEIHLFSDEIESLISSSHVILWQYLESPATVRMAYLQLEYEKVFKKITTFVLLMVGCSNDSVEMNILKARWVYSLRIVDWNGEIICRNHLSWTVGYVKTTWIAANSLLE